MGVGSSLMPAILTHRHPASVRDTPNACPRVTGWGRNVGSDHGDTPDTADPASGSPPGCLHAGPARRPLLAAVGRGGLVEPRRRPRLPGTALARLPADP